MAKDTKVATKFPLTAAYPFAQRHSLATDVDAIRDWEADERWTRGYESTIRRGRVITLFEDRGLYGQFVTEEWPVGASPAGEREKQRCLRIMGDYDTFVGGGSLPALEMEPQATEDALEFAVEAHLRDFLAKNLERIEPGLTLLTNEDRTGVEFPVDDGRIDILAIDRFGKHVVLELKLSRGRNRALGQLLYYMGWVDQHLGNAPCRGIIVASEITSDLITAVSRVPGVSLARYKMSFAIEEVSVRGTSQIAATA
jgi:hypothetical protein